MHSPAQHDPHTAPAPRSPEMGDRLVEAWADGTLVLPLRDESSPVRLPGLHKSVLPRSLSGQARAVMIGVGEHFAAWLLTPRENAPLIVRIPHVEAAELPHGLAHEVAALTAVPPEVGPDPIAVHDDATTSPIGHPYMVATAIPGVAAAPEAWTADHLMAHAEHMARLHSVSAPSRGPIALGADPWALLPDGPPTLLGEVAELAEQWRGEHAEVLAQHRLEPFVEAAVKRVERIEPEIAGLDGFVLAHGDLCATNILWSHDTTGPDAPADQSSRPSVRYIDFEWAQADDPARDLAIIGGPVHGGPWYVPMDEQQINGFIARYVEARAEHGEVPECVADTGALRRRMEAWTAYERTAMLVHVACRASQIADGSPEATPRAQACPVDGAVYHRALPSLRSTLAAFLGITE